LIVISMISIILLSTFSLMFYNQGQLNILLMLLIFTSILPFYYRYENRKPRAREIVVLAVTIALCVSSRVLFIITPAFKPMCAMIIIVSLVFGKEFGFLCGSMSAVISNIFFGQGPWTPYQMMALALIGLISGCFMDKEYNQSKVFLLLSGILSGVFYSMLLDIWTVLSIDQTILWSRYIAILIASLPTTLIYCISNVIFLWVLTPILMRKLTRVRIKYEF